MPFGCECVILNVWPYNQICIGCKFDRYVSEKDDQSDEFHGRGSICMRTQDADTCIRNNFRMSEEEQYAQMQKEDEEQAEYVKSKIEDENKQRAAAILLKNDTMSPQ